LNNGNVNYSFSGSLIKQKYFHIPEL